MLIESMALLRHLVGDLPIGDGRTVSYAQFVAPAMLAASAMNGALAETTMNFFGKMKYMRLYDAVLATPVTPFQVALGELIWALLRGPCIRWRSSGSWSRWISPRWAGPSPRFR